jgi:hypothetical protein
MYTAHFKDLVDVANKKMQQLQPSELDSGNPYYVGFGTPDSKVLFLGKEKAIDKIKRPEDFLYESINNPREWRGYIEKDIYYYEEKYDKTAKDYVNCFLPYNIKSLGGSTWSVYNRLLKRILGEANQENNYLFKKAFLTEINFQPSKLSTIKKFDHAARIEFLQHPFYKSFPITILGCGSYLNTDQVEAIFKVKHIKNLSEKRRKLIIYSDGSKRVLVQTNQLSFAISNEYLAAIREQVTKFIS